ncbi:MAG: hypothetical protein ABEJ73_00400 [Haloplanus sp.]
MTAPRERVGWALLFGLPMGVGVGLATARMARAEPTHPLVVGAAATTALLLVGVILGVTSVRPAETTE